MVGSNSVEFGDGKVSKLEIEHFLLLFDGNKAYNSKDNNSLIGISGKLYVIGDFYKMGYLVLVFFF